MATCTRMTHPQRRWRGASLAIFLSFIFFYACLASGLTG
jgi:hypothetical protein